MTILLRFLCHIQKAQSHSLLPAPLAPTIYLPPSSKMVPESFPVGPVIDISIRVGQSTAIFFYAF